MSYDDEPSRTVASFDSLIDGDVEQRASLLIYYRDGVEVVPLDLDQPVIIGRDESATHTFRDRALSRQHLQVTLTHEGVVATDLGSTNGTRLNGDPLGKATLRQDDELFAGSLVITLHRPKGTRDASFEGLLTHERFEEFVADEVKRCRAFGRPMALVMARCDEREGASKALLSTVGALLRPVDRVAVFGAASIEIALPEAGAKEATAFADRLVKRARGDKISVRCGCAVYPEADSEAALLELSREALSCTDKAEPVALHRSTDFAATGRQRDSGPVVLSSAMQSVVEQIERVAPSEMPVLILGETGTGKEVMAREIHRLSRRSDGPMRCVNCGAIPEELIESTLFGHERGSFTGATSRRKGVFEEANGGTVFLDEIGDLALRSQVALLRVLEERRFTRVGAHAEIEVDVRVLAATHRDLQAMCDAGGFRSDLYYRLNAVTLVLPPLRKRRDEIAPLVELFIQRSNEANSTAVSGIDQRALLALCAYSWPGNVRQLRNVIERATVIAQQQLIMLDDLPAAVAESLRSPSAAIAAIPKGRVEQMTPGPGAQSFALRERLQEYERQVIAAALACAGNNQSQAAKLLKMPRRTLVHKLGSLDVSPELVAAADREMELGDIKQLVAAEEKRLIEDALQVNGGNRGQTARFLKLPERTLTRKLSKHEIS